MNYQEFLKSKRVTIKSVGIKVTDNDIHPLLFPFQRDLTRWAAQKGRAAIFADTGLGKTLMQLEWARLMGGTVLIVAPLSVARQTVREGEKIDLAVKYVRHQNEVDETGIYITNYEMIDRFNPAAFDAVVLDESSILKSLTGKTRRKLTDMFTATPYKLCCTATPAPNDIAEIANHAEFLGIMTRANMLSSFFVHDDKGWRLRGHGAEAFYRWLASWGMSIKKPSDLGYDDDVFILPPLTVQPLFVPTQYCPDDQLFFTGLKGIQSRSKVRQATLQERTSAAIDLINRSEEQWIAWCGLNAESKALAKAIPGAIEVCGSDKLDDKIVAIEGFQNGKYRVLVTKPKIAGFGLNLQNAHKMAFVGLSDSWEAYYQCTRRCWRFMQEHPVDVHVILADVEDAIWQNVKRKEKEAEQMGARLIEHVKEFERAELGYEEPNGYSYEADIATTDNCTLMLGDSVERMAEVADESIHLSVFSPPFLDLYSYTPTERDVGNSHTPDEFFTHFGYIIDHLFRVTKPGRLCAVHTADIPALQQKDGYIGLKDFPGQTIRAFQERGWIYHGRVTIDKNPQAQAIRTHSKGLLFVQMEKDSVWSRPAIGDYILVFRKPGENETPITPVKNGDLTRDMWIEWAHPIWYGIRESDTLQYTTARGKDDDKHICPLQLETIERCIKLWSNPGETILSPFAGIGSELYQAVKFGRKAIGIELKQSYFRIAKRNIREAEREAATIDLFAFSGVEVTSGTAGVNAPTPTPPPCSGGRRGG